VYYTKFITRFTSDEKSQKPKKNTIFQSIRNNLTPSRIKKENPNLSLVLKKRSDSGSETSQISKTTTRKRASSVGVSESEIFTSRFRRIASGYISLGRVSFSHIICDI